MLSRAKECKVFWIYTSGCIRVSQQELDWLVENIELGTTVIM
ncbi:murein L,D-transpeptidase [Ruminococcus sp. AF25-13]|nr:murein L,D-transpeptidase [Ruminococcus sp. TF10-6]RGF26773.1 murein L,D-transpeptidase [Ruminococcus sp. AM09-18-1]RGG20348.1 murein L,D-transpeptidase [Ruminococcus sp. AF25-3LB]RGG26366.1 murein L,D-transpeptidase [Ruminococcus sp. AF25-17]RGG28567.1 murein L,D-transpeptidase [Ruminococcus sp. AF25-13]RGG36494.1 murein L,D-transpeptidase [Ruminococcus sp. AF24-16]RGH93817.1 murein L,D-transpeptidase [Ruminococcus sp. AM27-11LB]RGH95086.1 murein L,D-transpeptidase [Ruminococcus sp. AM27